MRPKVDVLAREMADLALGIRVVPVRVGRGTVDRHPQVRHDDSSCLGRNPKVMVGALGDWRLDTLPQTESPV
jgi:hypothetical protein